MSVLNNANDGDYSILRNLIKVISTCDNSISKDKLATICGAGISISIEKKLERKDINNTLNTWQKPGLVRVEENAVSVPKQYLDKAFYKNKFDEQKFKLLLVDILYLAENNKDFWSNEGGGSDDFTRGSTYLLARDVFNSNFQNSEGNLSIIKNGNRRSALIRWMYALGLMNSGHVADPTVLLKSFITNDKIPGEYSLTEFIDELSDHYPVLDGGIYRKILEEELVGASYNLLDKNQISISLSLALKRLRSQGCIELIGKADSANLTLTDRGNRATASFSHIKIIEGVKR